MAVAVDASARPEILDMPRVFSAELAYAGDKEHCAAGWGLARDEAGLPVPIFGATFTHPVRAEVMVGISAEPRDALLEELRYLAGCSQFFLSFRPLDEAELDDDWERPRTHGLWLPAAPTSLRSRLEELERRG